MSAQIIAINTKNHLLITSLYRGVEFFYFIFTVFGKKCRTADTSKSMLGLHEIFLHCSQWQTAALKVNKKLPPPSYFA